MSSAPFLPDAAAGLDGPDWLREQRRSAAEVARQLGPPSPELEEWRYSEIDELELGRYEPAEPESVSGGLVSELASSAGKRSGLVLCANGFLSSVELAGPAVDAEILVGRLLHHPDAEEIALSAAGPDDDALTMLNVAFAHDPLVIDVPAGTQLDDPILVVDQSLGGGVSFPRLLVRIGDDSHVRVVELFASDDRDRVVVPVTHMAIGRASTLRHMSLQFQGAETRHIARLRVGVDAQSTYRGSALVLGGRYGRTRTDCSLDGRGADSRISAAYLGGGHQRLDFRTFQDHNAPDTTSDLLYKGVVADESVSIYSGLITVSKEAPGTIAHQTNRNIKLGEAARAESVPNLEIETNDVRCSHASTVGPVDEDQRFYLESRGVPTPMAERLIVEGFFEEVLSNLPVDGLIDRSREWIGAKLDAITATGAETASEVGTADDN